MVDKPLRDGFRGWNILVVEDDVNHLDIIGRILSIHGAQVFTAVNGEEGLEAAKSLHPHFIITDLAMPVMDGWALITKLRQDHETADIPVIALSARVSGYDSERAFVAGCIGMLPKPLTPSTFVDDLLELLAEVPELAERLGVSS